MTDWDRAIELVKTRHTKSALVSYPLSEGQSQFCALGAIGAAVLGEANWINLGCLGGLSDRERYLALEENPRMKAMVNRVADAIREQYPEHGRGDWDSTRVVYRFNDSRDTTSSQLVTLFEKARIKDGEMIK